MPVQLEDDLAALVFRALMSKPPVSGHIIIQMLDIQTKLLLQLAAKVDAMSQAQTQTDKDFQTELAAFSADVEKQTTVTNGLKVAFAGVTKQIADLIAERQAAGASPDELAALRTLHSNVSSNTDAISAAVVTGTPAANEPPAPIVPPTSVDVPADASSGAAQPSAEGNVASSG